MTTPELPTVGSIIRQDLTVPNVNTPSQWLAYISMSSAEQSARLCQELAGPVTVLTGP